MDTSQLFVVLLVAVGFVADSEATPAKSGNLPPMFPVHSLAFNCSIVTCPHGTVPALIEGASAVPCPEDSHRPLVSHMHNGEPVHGTDECCLAPCKCKTPCPPPPSDCPASAPPRVSKPATGRPGACCPAYHCAGHEENSPGEPPPLALHLPHLPHASGFSWEPVPGGCVSEISGGIMANGYEWREDPCTTCRCEAGERKCHAYMCEASCVNPRHVPEECCPVCDSTSVVTLPPHCPSLANCSLRCRQGLLKDKDGCFLCQCQAEECKLDCPQGYSEDSLGNKLCECAESGISGCPFLSSCKKNCTHGLRTNRHGCPVCKCNKCRQMVFSSSTPNTDGGSEGTLLDPTGHGVMLLCTGPCLYGHIKDDRGCLTCLCNEPPHEPHEITTTYSEEVARAALPCTSSDGKEMDPNDVWWDGCRKCHCLHGSESCTMVSCPPTQACDNPVLIEGQCCPVCTEPTGHPVWIVMGMACFLLLMIIVILVIKHPRWRLWWSTRRFLCIQDIEEDVRLNVSPSPSPTHSPVANSQSNGSCKYNIPQLSSHEKGVREHYKYVPSYDTASVDSEKTFAPH